MSIATVVTRGYGTFGSIPFVVTRGFDISAQIIVDTPAERTVIFNAENRTMSFDIEDRTMSFDEENRKVIL